MIRFPAGHTFPSRMADPAKELRFTRSRQAAHFALSGLGLVAAGAGLIILRWWQLDHPPSLWPAVASLAGGVACLVFAGRLARHAFLLLSPVGVEIFPFFLPTRNFQLVPWGTVADASVDPDMKWLTIRLAGYEDAGIVISLAPIARRVRPLLVRAIEGVMERRVGAGRPDPAGPDPQ